MVVKVCTNRPRLPLAALADHRMSLYSVQSREEAHAKEKSSIGALVGPF